MEVSEIAFGGVEIGIPYGIGVKDSGDMLSETQAITLLQASVASGINFFDTARMYGMSESIMGKALKAYRKDIVIATKCKHFRNINGKIPDNNDLKKIIASSIRESLEALKTDYLDVFMLHQADLEILNNSTIATVFEELKKKGIVRTIGASTYTVDETDAAIECGIWDTIQLPFNLLDQRHETLFGKAKQKGIGIVVRSVLMKGLLSERGKNLDPALEKVENHIGKYTALLKDEFLDLPTLAMKFALSFGEVSSVLVGMDRMEYLHRSIATADDKYMNTEELKQAKQLAYPDPAFLDLPYWNKMGWLK